MREHKRVLSVLRLLVRLGWQPPDESWTVRCRDSNGRRAALRVHLAENGVVLAPSRSGPWTVAPLEVGKLRAALRDSVLTLDTLTPAEPPHSPAAREPEPRRSSTARITVRVDSHARPSVAEIAHRVAQEAAPTLTEVDDHGHHDARRIA